MTDKIRIWIAAILIIILLACLIWKGSASGEQQGLPPLNYSEHTTTKSEDSTITDNQQHSITTENSVVTDNKTNIDAQENYQMTAIQPYISRAKYEEINTKVALLHQSVPGFIGWLYMADSDIDYPVVQGTDNEYYLSHAPDGSYYRQGTLFLDWRCNRDLSDGINIIFGHNMQKGMFGDIRSFRTTEQFEAHRYGWFFTTEKIFRIDFFVLSIVSGFDELYDVPCPFTEWTDRLVEKAEFYRDTSLADSDIIVAFSTCAGDFNNARALFAGIMVEMKKDSSDYVK